MVDELSEVRDGMRIEWDLQIPVERGYLMADVFRPETTTTSTRFCLLRAPMPRACRSPRATDTSGRAWSAITRR
jgi:hypothetical protein